MGDEVLHGLTSASTAHLLTQPCVAMWCFLIRHASHPPRVAIMLFPLARKISLHLYLMNSCASSHLNSSVPLIYEALLALGPSGAPFSVAQSLFAISENCHCLLV